MTYLGKAHFKSLQNGFFAVHPFLPFQMSTLRIIRTQDACDAINSMDVSNRRGDLPNLTRQEFADLMLKYANECLSLENRGEELVVELPDGRILTYEYHYFPPTPRGLPELREWFVQLYTLKQRTPRCLHKKHIRKAWLYLAPYTEEAGYKTDPTGKWSYKVWA